MLRAHTARCVPCAQFQSEAVAITHKLRLAPLEPLPAPDRPASAPPRRRAGCCRSVPPPPSPRSRPGSGRCSRRSPPADEPHRARRAAHRGAALGRLPRCAAGPAAASAARVPVAHRARSGPHRHLTFGRAPGRSPPGPERGDCRRDRGRRLSGRDDPLDPRHLLGHGSRAVQRRRALGAAVEQRVLPAPPARPEDGAELEHELQRRPLARRGGRGDGEGCRERHRGARLVRRRRRGASTRRARRLAAQPELQRSPARQAGGPRNVVEWRAAGAGADRRGRARRRSARLPCAARSSTRGSPFPWRAC